VVRDGEGRVVLDGCGFAGVDGEGPVVVDADGALVAVGAEVLVDGDGAAAGGVVRLTEVVGAARCCRSWLEAQPARTTPEPTTATNAVTRTRQDLLRDAVTP